MSEVIRSASWWWRYFKRIYKINDYSVEGNLTLNAGEHEVHVSSKLPNPHKIYVSLEEPDDGQTTCLGNLNYVSVRLMTNGFILYANIKTTSCKIDYIIEYDSDGDEKRERLMMNPER